MSNSLILNIIILAWVNYYTIQKKFANWKKISSSIETTFSWSKKNTFLFKISNIFNLIKHRYFTHYFYWPFNIQSVLKTSKSPIQKRKPIQISFTSKTEWKSHKAGTALNRHPRLHNNVRVRKIDRTMTGGFLCLRRLIVENIFDYLI